MKVFLVPNYYKREAVESGLQLELWLSRQGFDVVWAADQRSGIESTPDLDDCGLVISLGGDGTLLRAARIVGYREIPILGLSYGHLGFLTAASPEDRNILEVVEDALAGELHVSRRATLDCRVFSIDEQGAERVEAGFALNDLALTRGPLSDMVEFDITVSDHHIDRLRGDGFVVSTATGSTGYALSAGGPIVSPEFTGMVCVPHRPAHHPGARVFDLALRRDRAQAVQGPPLDSRHRDRRAVPRGSRRGGAGRGPSWRGRYPAARLRPGELLQLGEPCVLRGAQ